jgi:predicted DNA-binding WGR domain protein
MRVTVKHYEYVGGNSSKFWEATYFEGDNFALRRWGRIGTTGQVQLAHIGDVAKAEKEKLSKGYIGTTVREYLVDGNRVTKALNSIANGDAKPFWQRLHDGVYENVADVLTDADDPMNSPPVEDPLVVIATRANAALSLAALQPQEAMVEFVVLTEEVDKHRQALKRAESNLHTLEMMLGLDHDEDEA